jgi:hypothetical protein
VTAYTFEASEQTIQVLSSDIVREAQRVIATAQASGVTYALLFAPYPTDPQGTVIWTDAAIQQQLDYWAGIWDQNSAVPGVLGISISQEVDATGRLNDVATVYVSSTSGKSSTSVSLGPREWLPSVAGTSLTTAFPDVIAATRARLDALEAGSAAPVLAAEEA